MRTLACLCLAAAAWAQGTEPKPAAGEYEAHARAGRIEIGAEYLVSSVTGQGKMFIVPDHLVVEAALFPPKGETVVSASGDFQLRVDGRTLRSGPAQGVVTAMERRAWQQPRGPRAAIGVGDDVVVIGGPTQPYPPYGGRGRTPRPPRAPEPENPSGLPPAPPVRAEELVVSSALPEGAFRGPVSGFLYFPFQGKPSKVRSVELIYGDTRLKLK